MLVETVEIYDEEEIELDDLRNQVQVIELYQKRVVRIEVICYC